MGNSCTLVNGIKLCCSDHPIKVQNKSDCDLKSAPKTIMKQEDSLDQRPNQFESDINDVNDFRNKQKVRGSKRKILQRFSVKEMNGGNNPNNNHINLIVVQTNVNNKVELSNLTKKNECVSVTPKMKSSANNLKYLNSNQKKTFTLVKDYANKIEEDKIKNINEIFMHSNAQNYFDLNNYDIVMLNYINMLRQRPEDFIKELKEIKENNIDVINDIKYIYANNTSEKFSLGDDFDNDFREMVKFIESHNNKMLNPIKYNDDLKVRLFSNEETSFRNSFYTVTNKKKSDNNFITDLEDKDIGDLILKKRLEIKEKYPNCYFNVNIIQDIKLSLLFLLLANNETDLEGNVLKSFRDVIFNPDLKEYAISCAKDKKRNFIAILSFA